MLHWQKGNEREGLNGTGLHICYADIVYTCQVAENPAEEDSPGGFDLGDGGCC